MTNLEKFYPGKKLESFRVGSSALAHDPDDSRYCIDCEECHACEFCYTNLEHITCKIRHQKYKRCLAMEDFCESQYDYYNTLGNGFWLVRGDKEKRDEYRKKASDFWWKWRNRWHELAEKFKDKETK